MDTPKSARVSLLVFLGLSAVLHGAVLVVLPGFQRIPDLPRFTTLEVVLVQAAAIAPRVKTAERSAIAPPAPRWACSTAAALTLPESAAAAPTLPAPAAEQAIPSDAGPKIETASIALTPPSFSAAYLSNPAPRYPLASRRSGEQGTVTLRVLVTREGSPARVDVEKSSGSPHLDAAALQAVKAWRFTPARQGQNAIESWMLVPVVFRLEGSS